MLSDFQFLCIGQDTGVLGKNVQLFCYVLSEGRKIESRCQLNPAIALRSKREEFGLETKQAQARERPQRCAGGRSKWTQSEARRREKRLHLRDVN